MGIAAGSRQSPPNRNDCTGERRSTCVTTWIEEPQGGRARGLRATLRAWVEVIVHPTRFFRNAVGPGDQAAGLTFAIAVAVVFAAGWLVVDPAVAPGISESWLLSTIVTLFVIGLLVTPVGLHLTAAIATISLVVAVRERAGVSETVQVVAYASAPFALAGPPIPALRVVCAAYATVLLVIGLRTVHRTSWFRATAATVLPALVGYWGGYRALTTLWTLASL